MLSRASVSIRDFSAGCTADRREHADRQVFTGLTTYRIGELEIDYRRGYVLTHGALVESRAPHAAMGLWPQRPLANDTAKNARSRKVVLRTAVT